MIPALVLACVPDLTYHTPTPVLTWDRVEECSRPYDDPLWTIDCDIGAYRLYRRDWPDQTWRAVEDSPCYWYVDDVETGPLRMCKNTHVAQKWTDDELIDADYCVRAVNAIGIESPQCSNVVTLCMPEMWHVGLEPYPW